jgi:hypothetical protein
MYSFGFSTTYWGAVLRHVHTTPSYLHPTLIVKHSRSLNGALNGNVGVIKSIVAEITDPTNLPQVYAYMPISWSIGGALG